MPHILVVNPNSSVEMTASIDRGLDRVRALTSVTITTERLPEAPAGIESQADVELASGLFANFVRTHPADAYVSACYSDPGLYLAREETDRLVVGIAESSFRYAVGLGQRFGIISILDASIPRHLRAVRQSGFSDWLANDRAINVHVADLGGDDVVDRVATVGETLRDADGAEVVILGCAGMARYREAVEARIGIPVIDPTQVAVARLVGMLMLGYSKAA